MGILQDEFEGDVGSVPQCQKCGSERVVKDAYTCWNPDTGLWEIENVFDYTKCLKCDAATTLKWVRPDTPQQGRIRELNDAFRTRGEGNGSIMVTFGVQEKGEAFVRQALHTVRTFDDFSNDNDPWGEHDFGAVDIDGEKVFWKLDYYNPSLTAGSENPANGTVTHRVLTVMLASEY